MDRKTPLLIALLMFAGFHGAVGFAPAATLASEQDGAELASAGLVEDTEDSLTTTQSAEEDEVPYEDCTENPSNLLSFDSDGDGDPNLQELAAGSDPCDSDSTMADIDGDGYTNTEECPTPNQPTDECTNHFDPDLHPSEISLQGNTAETDGIDPGETDSYDFQVRNDGRASDRILVSWELLSSSDWTTAEVSLSSPDEMEPDDDPFAPEPDPDTILLGLDAGASTTVTVTVTSPLSLSEGGRAGHVGSFVITFEPQADDERKPAAPGCGPPQGCQLAAPEATLDLTTNSVGTFQVDLDADASVLPGGDVTYAFTLTSLANEDRPVGLSTDTTFNGVASLPSGYTMQLRDQNGDPLNLPLTLPAEGTAEGSLYIAVPPWDFDAPVDGAFAEDQLAVELDFTSGSDTIIDAVTTTTDLLGDLTLEVDGSNAITAAPSATATHTLTVTNLGNGEDPVEIVVDTPADFGSDGYVLTAPASDVPIASGAQRTLTVDVTVPDWDVSDPEEGAYLDAETIIEVTATTSADSGVEATHPLTTTTDRLAAVELEVVDDEDAFTVLPNEDAEYALTVRNLGNGEDTFSIDVAPDADFGNDGYTFLLPTTTITLSAEGRGTIEQDVSVTVQVPAWNPDAILDGARFDATTTVDVTATSDSEPTALDTKSLATTTDRVVGLGLTFDEEASTLPGMPSDHTLYVRNLGNGPEAFEVESTVPDNFTQDGFGLNALPSTLNVVAAAVEPLPVEVEVPGWDPADQKTAAVHGAKATININVTSSIDATLMDNQELTTTTDQVFGFDLVASITGRTAAPGSTAIFSIKAINLGNGNETLSVAGEPVGDFFADGYTFTAGSIPELKRPGLPNDERSFTMKVDVPEWDLDQPVKGSIEGSQANLTTRLTGMSGDETVLLTTTTGVLLAGNLEALDPPGTLTPEETTAKYKVRLTHQGSADADHGLSTSSETGWSATTVDCDDDLEITRSPVMAYGDTFDFCVIVAADRGRDVGHVATTTVRASSNSANLDTTVVQDLDLSPVATESTGSYPEPNGRQRAFHEDETKTITITITNNGDGWDRPTATYTLTAGAGWESDFVACDGDIDDDDEWTAPWLAPGDSADLCLEVSVGVEHTVGEQATLDFTITSGIDDGSGKPVTPFSLTLEIWDLDIDEDGVPDHYDPDIDGDSHSNIQENSAGSDPRDRYSTPFDGDGDGVPNMVETFVQFDMDRDERLSQEWFDNGPAGTPISALNPISAVPDPTSIDKVTLYNINVNPGPPLLTRASGDPILTLERQGDVYALCIHEVDSPVNQLSESVEECVDEALLDTVLTEHDLGPVTVGVDDNGEPVFEALFHEENVTVSVMLRGGELRVGFPVVQTIDRDGDGVPLVYTIQTEVIFDPTPRIEQTYGTDIGGDPDDNDPDNPVQQPGRTTIRVPDLTGSFTISDLDKDGHYSLYGYYWEVGIDENGQPVGGPLTGEPRQHGVLAAGSDSDDQDDTSNPDVLPQSFTIRVPDLAQPGQFNLQDADGDGECALYAPYWDVTIEENGGLTDVPILSSSSPGELGVGPDPDDTDQTQTSGAGGATCGP